MMQKYKVFVQDTAVYFVSKENLSELENRKFRQVDLEESEPVSRIYEAVRQVKKSQPVVAFHTNIEIGWKYFCDAHKLIEAAGGLVKNNSGAILCIFRNNRWDLPKGKIEIGESQPEAAMREVEEECGIPNLKLGKKLYTTFHTYEMNNQKILKPTYWFSMISEQSSPLIPQIEEGITQVRWVNKETMNMILENTYPSLFDIFKFA